MPPHLLIAALVARAGGSLAVAKAMHKPSFQGTLHKICAGHVANPARASARRIAEHFSIPVDGGSRSRAVRAEFMRQQPCPATGQPRGACPGYQVDHRTPLCIGGADRVENLQWLSIEAHKRKTKIDVRLCRANL